MSLIAKPGRYPLTGWLGRDTPRSERYLESMSCNGPAACDRVLDRRSAVALARHFREAEGLSIAQIAARLGRAPATIKPYFYDPFMLTNDLRMARRSASSWRLLVRIRHAALGLVAKASFGRGC